MGLARSRGRGDIAERHLAKVNEWTIDEAKQYVWQQFEIWRLRSKRTWRLDITWLEQYGITAKPPNQD